MPEVTASHVGSRLHRSGAVVDVDDCPEDRRIGAGSLCATENDRVRLWLCWLERRLQDPVVRHACSEEILPQSPDWAQTEVEAARDSTETWGSRNLLDVRPSGKQERLFQFPKAGYRGGT